MLRKDVPMGRRRHWQQVYADKSPLEVSWYRPHLETSLELITATGVATDDRIIDVGGGASTLVDDLLEAGYNAITVLDISDAALDASRRRLGSHAADVTWLEGDVTKVDLGAGDFELWHDRAALHFLVDEDDRRSYAATLKQSLVPGGHAVLATFAPDGPPRCSGLRVRRHDASMLAALLGDEFVERATRQDTHRTPSGNEQLFTYCWFQKLPSAA